jgi:hypothetical protein
VDLGCASNDTTIDFDYEWQLTSYTGSRGVFVDNVTDSNMLTLPANYFEPGHIGTFKVSGGSSFKGYSSFMIYFLASSLKAVITGGNRNQGENQLILSGQNSVDPDDADADLQYFWECKALSMENKVCLDRYNLLLLNYAHRDYN